MAEEAEWCSDWGDLCPVRSITKMGINKRNAVLKLDECKFKLHTLQKQSWPFHRTSGSWNMLGFGAKVTSSMVFGFSDKFSLRLNYMKNSAQKQLHSVFFFNFSLSIILILLTSCNGPIINMSCILISHVNDRSNICILWRRKVYKNKFETALSVNTLSKIW